MIRPHHLTVLVCLSLAACGTSTTRQGTLAELEQMPADVDEVYLDDSLELAAQSYRRYLEETKESAMTPEAMRRLADLQIEQEYGVPVICNFYDGTGDVNGKLVPHLHYLRKSSAATIDAGD